MNCFVKFSNQRRWDIEKGFFTFFLVLNFSNVKILTKGSNVKKSLIERDRQTDKQIDRQTDRQTDRDRQIKRLMDR